MQIVLRHSRVKQNQLDSVDGHNRRIIPVENCDSEKTHLNTRLYGEDKPTVELIDRRLLSLGLTMNDMDLKSGKSGKRKDMTTVAVELVISASPEYFRPENPAAHHTYDQKRLEDWQERVMAWLHEEFGDNLLCVDLHLDESTPHLHVQTIPLIQKEMGGRSNKDEMVVKNAMKDVIEARVRAECADLGITDEKKIITRRNKAWKAEIPKNHTYMAWRFDSSTVDSKANLERRQTRIAEYVADIGLERGIPSIKDAETIGMHYQAIYSDLKNVEAKMKKVLNEKPTKEERKEMFSIKIPDKPLMGIGYVDIVTKYFKDKLNTIKGVLSQETKRADKYVSLYEQCLTQLSYTKRKLSRLNKAVSKLGKDPEKAIEDFTTQINLERDKARIAANSLKDYESQEPDRIAHAVNNATAAKDEQIEILKNQVNAANNDRDAMYNILKGRKPDAARNFIQGNDRTF